MMRFPCLEAVIVFAAILSLSHAQYSLVFTGSMTCEPFLRNVAFDFLSVNQANAVVSYSMTNDTLGRQSMISATNAFDVATSATPFTNSDVSTAAANGIGLLSTFPFMAAPVVVIYNVPGLANTFNLLIDKSTLFNIWAQRDGFKTWSCLIPLNSVQNRALASLPPLPACDIGSCNLLPAVPINFAMRQDPSTTVNAFLRAMASVSGSSLGQFPVTPSDQPTWPQFVNVSNCPTNVISPIPGLGTGALNALGGQPQYTCLVNYDWPVSQVVVLRPYTMALMGSQFITGLPYFVYQPQNGVQTPAIYPSVSAVQSAVTAASMLPSTYGVSGTTNQNWASSTSPVGDLQNVQFMTGANNDAWPVNEIYYFLLPQIASSDCARALEIAQFMIWAMQSSTAQGAMTYLGYAALPANIVTTVGQAITLMQCGSSGSVQNAYDSLYGDWLALRIVSAIITAILLLTACFLGWKMHHPAVVKTGGFAILAFMCCGAAGNLMTIWGIYTGWAVLSACRARPWTKCLELVTIYSVFLVQLKIYLRLKDKDQEELELKEAEEEKAAAAAAAGTGSIEMTPSTGGPVVSANGASHDSGKGDWVSSLSQMERQLALVGIGAAVFSIWCIIPIVWTSVETPSVSQRKCVSPFLTTFQMIEIGFNIILIFVTAGIANVNGTLDVIVHPVFIMLMCLALFQPMYFIQGSAQFPIRVPVALVLQQGVGTIVGTSLECILILGPCIQACLTMTPEQYIERIALEKDVAKFRTQRTQRSLQKSLEKATLQ